MLPADSDVVTADILGIGLFAQAFDRTLIDSVLQETGRREQRVRLLPAYVVVHLVLGLALHADKSYAEVIDRLAHAAHQIRGGRGTLTIPTGGAITAARTRLGSAPLIALFNRAALPLAKRNRTHSFLEDLLVVEASSAVLNVADSPANARAFGYSPSSTAPFRSTLPQIRVSTLAEAGTQATIGATLGPSSSDVQELAVDMVKTYLRPGMLLITGQQLYSPAMWVETLSNGADLLSAVENSLPLPVITVLPDGTYLSTLPLGRGPVGPARARTVRVLTCLRASPDGDSAQFSLISSLLAPDEASAEQLLAVYAGRTDDSVVFTKFNAQSVPDARPLRSRKPDLVHQEIWGHLLSHYAIRAFINQAAEEVGEPFDDPSDTGDIALVRHPAEAPSRRPARAHSQNSNFDRNSTSLRRTDPANAVLIDNLPRIMR